MDKDSSRTTAGELQKIVESRGQKQLLHQHMLFGRVSRDKIISIKITKNLNLLQSVCIKFI